MQVADQSIPIPYKATQQINIASNNFQDLVNSLRKKQRKSSKDIMSQFNPQQNKSVNTNQYFSERLSQDENASGTWAIKDSKTKRSIMTGLQQQDDIIRLKPKGNVAGRDVVQKKKHIELPLPKHSFDHKIADYKEDMKNKIIKVSQSPSKNQQIDTNQLSKIEKRDNRQDLYSSLASFGPKSNINEIRPKYRPHQVFNNTYTQGIKLPENFSPSFPQNKLNRLMATSKKIKDINDRDMKKFLQNEAQPLGQRSQLKQILLFFNKLCEKMSIILQNPLIKKYRNCIYYGQQIDFEDHYEGFLYFHDGRFYYGELINGKKWGQGTEISASQQSMTRGYFTQGQKTGKFQVKKHDQHYIGYLQNGLYHGQGKLVTKDSVYTGSFAKGQKHGLGQQIFPKTGLKLVGYYYHGAFDSQENNNKRSYSHSKPQLVSNTKANFNEYSQLNGPKTMSKLRNSSSNHFGTSRNFQMPGINNQPQLYAGATKRHVYREDELGRGKNMQETKKRLFNPEKLVKLAPMYEKYPERSMMQYKSKNNRDSYSNGITNLRNKNKVIKGVQQYDYSFDMSSKKDNDSLFGHYPQLENRSFHQNNSTLSRNDEMYETNQFEEPLPIPHFQISRR